MDYLFCHKDGIDRSSVAQSVFTSGLDAFMIEEIIKHKLLVSLLKCNKETSRRAHEGSNIFDQIWMWKSILSSLRNSALTLEWRKRLCGRRTDICNKVIPYQRGIRPVDHLLVSDYRAQYQRVCGWLMMSFFNQRGDSSGLHFSGFQVFVTQNSNSFLITGKLVLLLSLFLSFWSHLWLGSDGKKHTLIFQDPPHVTESERVFNHIFIVSSHVHYSP